MMATPKPIKTMQQSSSSSSGGLAVLPLAGVPDPSKKNLKTEFDQAMVQFTPVGTAPGRDLWEVVHCGICMAEFYKDELSQVAGGLRSCPKCQNDSLKQGRLSRTPKDKVEFKTADRTTSAKRTPPRTPPARERSPRPASMPPKLTASSIIKVAGSLMLPNQKQKKQGCYDCVR